MKLSKKIVGMVLFSTVVLTPLSMNSKIVFADEPQVVGERTTSVIDDELRDVIEYGEVLFDSNPTQKDGKFGNVLSKALKEANAAVHNPSKNQIIAIEQLRHAIETFEDALKTAGQGGNGSAAGNNKDLINNGLSDIIKHGETIYATNPTQKDGKFGTVLNEAIKQGHAAVHGTRDDQTIAIKNLQKAITNFEEVLRLAGHGGNGSATEGEQGLANTELKETINKAEELFDKYPAQKEGQFGKIFSHVIKEANAAVHGTKNDQLIAIENLRKAVASFKAALDSIGQGGNGSTTKDEQILINDRLVDIIKYAEGLFDENPAQKEGQFGKIFSHAIKEANAAVHGTKNDQLIAIENLRKAITNFKAALDSVGQGGNGSTTKDEQILINDRLADIIKYAEEVFDENPTQKEGQFGKILSHAIKDANAAVHGTRDDQVIAIENLRKAIRNFEEALRMAGQGGNGLVVEKEKDIINGKLQDIIKHAELLYNANPSQHNTKSGEILENVIKEAKDKIGNDSIDIQKEVIKKLQVAIRDYQERIRLSQEGHGQKDHSGAQPDAENPYIHGNETVVPMDKDERISNPEETKPSIETTTKPSEKTPTSKHVEGKKVIGSLNKNNKNYVGKHEVKSTLPQTGEVNTFGMTLAGIALSLSSLFGLGKLNKKRN